MNTALLTAGAAFLAAAVTKITDLFRNAIDLGDTLPKWLWNVVPLGLGLPQHSFGRSMPWVKPWEPQQALVFRG
ncbi:MAG: hypothetical protein M3046_09295 [Actinomycetota bacterium]|nr:hypothetical protein [Actinomycetota bacterium]